MTTGRINQVATSRAAPDKKSNARSTVSPPCASTAPTVSASGPSVFERQPIVTNQCRKGRQAESTSQALRLGRTSRRASCCLLAVFLERSYRTAAVQAPPLQREPRGRKQSWAKVSLRCAARAASLPPEGRLSLPLSHAIGSELMLGIA